MVDIGVAAETKEGETRVALSPWGVEQLLQDGSYGHAYVMHNAGVRVLTEISMHPDFLAAIKNPDGSLKEFLKMTPTWPLDQIVQREDHRIVVAEDADYLLINKRLGSDRVHIVDSQSDLARKSDLVVTVKELQIGTQNDLIKGLHGKHWSGFPHLSGFSKPDFLEVLLQNHITTWGYEDIAEVVDGGRRFMPILAEMSWIAGQQAVQIADNNLQGPFYDGRGIVLGNRHGVEGAKVVVIGGGQVGSAAAYEAVMRGANVTVLDKEYNITRSKAAYVTYMLDNLFPAEDHSTPESWLKRLSEDAIDRIRPVYTQGSQGKQRKLEELTDADVVIIGVKVPNKEADLIMDAEAMDVLKDKCFVADVSIDEGGATAATYGGKYTTHSNPIKIYTNRQGHRIKVFAIQNIPTLRSDTASHRLEAASVPYFSILGKNELDIPRVLAESPALARSLTTYNGFLTNETVYRRYTEKLHVQGIPFKPISELFPAA